MAITVDWGTGVISVPKADTTLVSAGPPEIRDYDVYEKMWKELKALEDDEAGIVFVDAQSHVTTKTVGGVTLAHVVEIINGYTVTFEAGTYQVNTKGANHNVLDVANLNATGLRSSNSPGLILVASGTGIARPLKGQALSNFDFVMLDPTTKLPKTGLTVSGQIRKDAGALGATANSPTEVANGVYAINLTAAEMTADKVTLRFTATGADPQIITIVTATQ